MHHTGSSGIKMTMATRSVTIRDCEVYCAGFRFKNYGHGLDNYIHNVAAATRDPRVGRVRIYPAALPVPVRATPGVQKGAGTGHPRGHARGQGRTALHQCTWGW